MADRPDERQEAPGEGTRGVPGEGKGRRDEVGPTGIYPASGPHPPGDAPIRGQGALAHPEERELINDEPPTSGGSSERPSD